MARGPRPKLLPMYVDADLYRRLEEAAKTADREATQQAVYFIRRGLERAGDEHEHEAEHVG